MFPQITVRIITLTFQNRSRLLKFQCPRLVSGLIHTDELFHKSTEFRPHSRCKLLIIEDNFEKWYHVTFGECNSRRAIFQARRRELSDDHSAIACEIELVWEKLYVAACLPVDQLTIWKLFLPSGAVSVVWHMAVISLGAGKAARGRVMGRGKWKTNRKTNRLTSDCVCPASLLPSSCLYYWTRPRPTGLLWRRGSGRTKSQFRKPCFQTMTVEFLHRVKYRSWNSHISPPPPPPSCRPVTSSVHLEWISEIFICKCHAL